MSSSHNHEPAQPGPPAHVHLLGICGTGMASLAGMFHEAGYRVSGSDQAVYPPMSDFLAEMGIPVTQGYSPANLVPRPDLAVVGNVIRRANPEAQELERSGVPFVSMPVALSRYFAGDKTRVVVAGTHGKTTLSAMVAWILFEQGLDPGFMIGGIPINFRKNHRLGKGSMFVLEGDEYDTAYFDKQPKFLHYRPDVAIVTSCEFDHADIYRDIEHIESQFRAFIGLIPRDGTLVAYADDARVRRLAAQSGCKVVLYGTPGRASWSAGTVRQTTEGIYAEVSNGNGKVAKGLVPVFGVHNLMNAIAAVAAAESVGVDPERALKALGSFAGVRRRQQVLADHGGVLVLDDFAHHPTAVRVTCEAVKARFPSRRLVAVFEPRTNTSRRSVFQQDYVSALTAADEVLVREPRDVALLPEPDRFSSMRLASDLRDAGRAALCFDDTDLILDHLAGKLREQDVVLIMSNGNFDNLGPRLVDILKGGSP